MWSLSVTPGGRQRVNLTAVHPCTAHLAVAVNALVDDLPALVRIDSPKKFFLNILFGHTGGITYSVAAYYYQPG